MRVRPATWRYTVAKVVASFSVIYFAGSAALLWYATRTDRLFYWFTGSLLLLGGIIVVKCAWDIRK
jgi:hypothetical protein